ncbi:hypothetical protein [Leisingera caerulea]|uniref:hypothetical protein n=1 Tax=Leisingera caerulea TaxID=506591 RepID=UPI0021A54109|nr:hypothetical protein [Leisingera caerulea]UWQ83126.1 hypothetical protein K3726_15895 [Leisingera caerulea]
MTTILVLPLSSTQASRLREMADFEGETLEGMIKTLITRGFWDYESEVSAMIAEMEELRSNPPPLDGDDDVPY